MEAPPAARWLHDYFRWLGQPYYVALQSAAATCSSAPQPIQVTQVMTDKPRREIVLGRQRIRFFVKGRAARTPTHPLASAHSPLRVSTPEAAAFDLVRHASRMGGLDRALETLRPMLPLMRIPQLQDMLEAESETSTAQRLGYANVWVAARPEEVERRQRQ